MAVAPRRWAAELLHYWFHTLRPRDWFGRSDAVDAALRRRFGPDLKAMAAMSADSFLTDPLTARAAILLFDQVPRNIHRGSPLAFASDAKALRLAKGWIGQGFHQKLPAPRARWLIMPYEHAEDLDAQQRCVALFRSMGLSEMAHWAQVHLDIIARFGRFPHRNAVLGRVSTPDELAFLAAGGFAG